MQPFWLTTLANILILLLMLAIPAIVIALGVGLGLRLLRGESSAYTIRVFGRNGRPLLIAIAIVIGFLWLFLSFNVAVRPGQSTLPIILPALLFMMLHYSLYLLVIAGAIWLVLWLARRLGVVSPARESPLDILKARYARGELSKAQFEELKHDLADP